MRAAPRPIIDGAATLKSNAIPRLMGLATWRGAGPVIPDHWTTWSSPFRGLAGRGAADQSLAAARDSRPDGSVLPPTQRVLAGIPQVDQLVGFKAHPRHNLAAEGAANRAEATGHHQVGGGGTLATDPAIEPL